MEKKREQQTILSLQLNPGERSVLPQKLLPATQSISFGGTARACKTSVTSWFIHTRFFSKIIVYSKTLFFTWPVLKIKRKGGYQQVLPIAKSQVTVFNQKSNFEEKLKIEIVIVDNLSPLRLTTSWSWDQFWTKSVATVGCFSPGLGLICRCPRWICK